MKISGIKIFHIVSSVIIFLILFLYYFHPIVISSGDLGYYLKTGELIFADKLIPNLNLFSYTYPKYPFINPNWFAEIVFYILYKFFGFYSLIILSTIVMLLSFLIIFLTAKKYNLSVTLILSLLYIQVLFERTDVKPEIFSYLLLSVFLSILYKYKDKFTKWIYLLIPLELIWVNSHIYFFIGIAVLLIFLLDIYISEKKLQNNAKVKTLTFVTLSCISVTILNPSLLAGSLYPFTVFSNYGFKVEENINFYQAISNPNYSDPTFLYFGVLLILLWISIMYIYKKNTIADLLLSVFFSFLGLFAIRSFPLFVFGTFIVSVRTFGSILSRSAYRFKKRKSIYYILIYLIILISIIPTINSNVRMHGLGLGVIDNAEEAVSFIVKNDIKGPIYNNFDIGNYLDFKLYPREKVFVDARAEAYPKSFFENIYFPIQDSPQVFNKIVKKYKINYIILAHNDATPLLKYLVNSVDWKMVFLNNTIVIFLRNNSENNKIINSYEITEKNIIIKNSDINDKEKVRRLVNFFHTINWMRPWLLMNLKYLAFEPLNCSALQNIAFILNKQNDSKAIEYINKYSSTCMTQ